MRPLYNVVEEVWSISSKPDERRRLSTSDRPLFSGGTKRLAYAYAQELVSKFRFYGVHDEDDQLYWWGRNEDDHVNRRFLIEPAPPSLPVFVGKDGHPRGRRSRYELSAPIAVNAPGATNIA
jgi:hypothetical protein